MLSLKAKIAVGGSGSLSSAVAASRPPSMRKPVLDEVRVGEYPRTRKRGLMAAQSFLGREPAMGTGHDAYPPVPEGQQVPT